MRERGAFWPHNEPMNGIDPGTTFRLPGVPPSGQPPGGALGGLVRAAVREPFSARARREALYCLISAPLGIASFVITVYLLAPGLVISASVLGTVIGLLLVIFSMRVARWLGGRHRRLAARVLGVPIAGPPPFQRGQGILSRLDARLKDGTGWRAVGYMLVKLPVSVLQFYALAFWVNGVINLSYPLWWPLFRNSPPGTHPNPVAAVTPLPFGNIEVSSWWGTFLAAIVGALLVLAAPWLTRGVVTADRWLIRSLLGPGSLAQRVSDLEQARARAVDDSAALLRQVERDLHDGAQARLAAMALNLGMAKEKLGTEGNPPDMPRARELIDAAHRGAKEALVELRELVRGIHPPVLDNGLADALATLAAGSPIPVRVSVDVPARPTPAIETIAYFCAAELLANATKHSAANKIEIKGGIADTERGPVLRLTVSDDGLGGAVPGPGSGLDGLTRRTGTVDGRLDIVSPPGGPTRITVELPLRA
jgi:signal transduction histidine kinase